MENIVFLQVLGMRAVGRVRGAGNRRPPKAENLSEYFSINMIFILLFKFILCFRDRFSDEIVMDSRKVNW